MPTTQEINITRSAVQGHELSLWHYVFDENTDPLDESTIVPGFTPAPVDGWWNMGAYVDFSQGIQFNHDGRGHTFTFTLAEENRELWPDRVPILLMAGHFDGTGWSDAECVCWGRLQGDATATANPGRKGKATRTVSYTKWWDKLPVDGRRFGKPNLALNATITASSAVLATPMEEAPLEFESQADVAANRIVDGNSDTVSVLNVVAYPTMPTIGDTAIPRILRMHNGRFPSRSVGAGGQCMFIELWAGHNTTTWGDFEGSAGSLPVLGDPNDGGNPPTVSDNDDHTFSLASGQGRSGTKGLLMRFKERYNANGTPREPYLQWNLNVGAQNAGVPMKVSFWLKAASTESIGKVVTISSWMRFGETKLRRITLSQQYTKYEFAWDNNGVGDHGFRLRVAQGELAGGDIYCVMDDFRVVTGYSDQAHSDYYDQRYHLTFDDAAGHVRWVRPAWELAGSGDFIIPPEESIIITDDANLFKARFNAGNRTVYQMKNLYPEWYFAPGVGKVRAGWNGVSDFFDWTPNGSFVLIELVDFDPGGNANDRSWTVDQALSRQSPVGTGALSVENFPHVGLLLGEYGAGYWVADLGAYSPSVLSFDISNTATLIPVDNLDEYAASGRVKIGSEYINYSGKTENAEGIGSLIVTARGVSASGAGGGSTAASHTAGDLVYPMLTDGLGADSGTATGTFAQSGWLIDTIELRRKEGTPKILSGVVLTSNLVSPRDPSDPDASVGAKWERHPDWRLVTRFADLTNGLGSVITLRMTDTIRQARHVAVVIDRMETDSRGQPQRAKLNELIVRKAAPVGNLGGGWGANSVNTLGGLVLHMLLKFTDLPEAKVIANWLGPSLDAITVAPGTVASVVQSATERGLLNIWCDPWNRLVVEPSPAHPAFDARVPEWTWEQDDVQGDLAVTWADVDEVAQVRVSATDPETLKVYTSSYPATRLRRGQVREYTSLIAHSAQEADELAYALFRDASTRRSCTVKCSAAPWLRPWQRHVLNWLDVEGSGSVLGVNMVVTGYSATIKPGTAGYVWETTINLREMAL